MSSKARKLLDQHGLGTEAVISRPLNAQNLNENPEKWQKLGKINPENPEFHK